MPVFKLKALYAECDAPTSIKDGQMARWPIKTDNYSLDLSNFARHLSRDMNLGSSGTGKHVLAMTRFFHMFEEPDHEPIDSTLADNIGVVVSLFLGGELERMLDSPLLGSEYSWTRDMLSALQAFGKFMTAKATLEISICSCVSF